MSNHDRFSIVEAALRFQRVLLLIIIYTFIMTSFAFAEALKIMPIGNSITAGEGSSTGNGFRQPLLQNLNNSGYGVEFVGPHGAPFNGFFKSGAKIEEFLPGGAMDVSWPLSTYHPDIVLVHLGTNNTSNEPGPYTDSNSASGKLHSLLGTIAQQPSVRYILVCKIIPKLVGGTEEENVRLFNAQIEEMYFDNPPTDNLTIVDMYSAVSTGQLVDGVHPGDSGYENMAIRYEMAIADLINESNPDKSPPSRISWKRAFAINSQSAQLEWYAPSDDGVSRTASIYELRYATFELTSTNFDQGKLVSVGKPGSAGSVDRTIVENLLPDQEYFFAIRAYDEAGHVGPLSESIFVETSTSGIEYCDDFCDPELSKWSASPNYQAIDCILQNTNPNAGWSDLAVFKAVAYNPNAPSVEASLTWSEYADDNGVNASGVAMLLDTPNYENASGYLVRVRDRKVYLEVIENGIAQQGVLDQEFFFEEAPSPAQGDVLRIKFSRNVSLGNIFNVFINDNWVGQVHDPNKQQGIAERLYSGVMLYGGMSNDISHFCVAVPPLEAHSMAVHTGDNETGQVEEKMAIPLAVKVSDVNDQGVSGVYVDYSVVSGQAYLSADSIAQQFNGNVWMEAESGNLQEPMISSSASNASGGKFIYVPNLGNTNNKGQSTYKIYIPRGDTYYLYLRVYAHSGTENSCYFGIRDTTQTQRWDFQQTGSWVWYKWPGPTTLNEGFVDFVIKNREANTWIDKILLSANPGYNPTGLGGTTQMFSNITNLEGFASTDVTFGQQAGPVEIEAYAPQVPNSNRVTFDVTALAGDPIEMVRTSQSTMTGVAGELLSESFSVQLSDKFNNYCSGVMVQFAVTEGDGTFNNRAQKKVFTNQQGVAEAQLKLGYTENTTVSVTLPNYPNISPLEFRGVAGEGIPVEILEIDGNNQQASVTETLPTPLEIQVNDERGIPVPNFPVPFEIISGNGTVDGEAKIKVDTTNADGIASVVYTLGDSAGVHLHQVEVNPSVPLDNAPITFIATALPDDPYQVVKQGGENQMIGAGHIFSDPLEARVTDQYGNGIADYEVRFRVVNGDGNFAERIGTSTSNADTTITSDESGIASITYTAGSVVDNHQIRVDGIPSLPQGYRIFTALTVTQPTPNRIVKLSGDMPMQESTVGSQLGAAFNVQVLDPFNLSVGSNTKVVFKTITGGGRFSGADSVIVNTDNDGKASALYTLGTASGTQTIQVYVQDYPDVDPVEFNARALPAAAQKIEAESPVSFTEKTGTGPIPLRVKVTDQFDNPRPGQIVTFSVDQGGGYLSNNASSRNVVSDSVSGIAMVNYFMGTNTGIRNLISATALKSNGQHLQNSPIEFRGTVKPDEPASLAKVSGDDPVQTARVLTTCQDSFVVVIKDKFNNPVPNTEVVFQVTSSGGSVEGKRSISKYTNEFGQAWTFLTVGSTAGDESDKLRAHVPNFQNIPPVTFVATATPAPPHRIYAMGDSVWAKQVSATDIILHPKVKVEDTFGNAIPNLSVFFEITSGLATVNDQDSVTLKTQKSGESQVAWTLGHNPGTYNLKAHARQNGSELNNSPVTFTATLTEGNPRYLKLINAPGDTSIAGQKIPITVRVTDVAENPISNHAVTFDVSHHNDDKTAFFEVNGEQASHAEVKTDEQGYAHVGFIPILRDNQVRISSVDNNGYPLEPSPISVFIWGVPTQAKRVELLSSNHLSVVAGQSVAVRVAAYDAEQAGNPIDGHRIQFSVLKGDGYLGSTNYTYSSVETRNGEALETWYVGHKVGEENLLECDGGNLPGSPDTVSVNVLPTTPSADSSFISASGKLKADGSSYAMVTVTVVDSFGNRVPNKQVELISDDEGVLFEQPGSRTDQNGRTIGKVRATQVGQISVAAILPRHPDIEICCATLNVKPGDATRLEIANTTNEFVGNQGAMLKDSLQVIAKDKFGNKVPYEDIKFEIKSGSGYFYENRQRIYYEMTDSTGLAAAHLVCGQEENENYLIYASLNNPDHNDVQVAFLGTSRVAPPPFSVHKVAGDSLSAPVGQSLAEPFVVQVVDRDGIPVWNTPVTFKTLGEADGEFVDDNPVLTDERGYAENTYKFTKRSGQHQIMAQLTGNSQSVIFTAFGLANDATTLLAATNPVQNAVVGKEYDELVVIQSQDKDGNPSGGVQVAFTLEEQPTQVNGAAVLDPKSMTTDKNGLAAAKIRLGEKTGEYVFKATSPNLVGSVTFHIHGTSDVAKHLVKYSGDEQSMTRGRELVHPVVVKVTDQYSNPVPHETVYFAAEGNSGFVRNNKSETDSSGLASTRWVIGQDDVNKLLATKVGLQPGFIRFYANGVDNAFPEFQNMPDSVTINYSELFTLNLTAEDEDNDPLSYEVIHKPVNATFNADTKIFAWTPTVSQKGLWTVAFRVEDNKSGYMKGFDVDSVVINVTSHIKIFSYYPTEMPEIRKPQNVEFGISVTDQASNNLNYSWYVDDVKEPVNAPKFTFYSTKYSRGNHSIKVIVTDGVSADSLTWSTIVTRVELSSFQAASLPYEGVRLDWETANEINNAGFEVLRSLSAEGSYKKINTVLIESNDKGTYSFVDTSTVAGRTYHYKLEDVSTNGYRHQSKSLKVNVEIPHEFRLLQNFPNPFNPETRIRFQLPKPAETTARIYNVRGQEVKTLVDKKLSPGYYEIPWKGENNGDLRVSSGVYYIRIQAGEYQAIKKMVMLK